MTLKYELKNKQASGKGKYISLKIMRKSKTPANFLSPKLFLKLFNCSTHLPSQIILGMLNVVCHQMVENHMDFSSGRIFCCLILWLTILLSQRHILFTYTEAMVFILETGYKVGQWYTAGHTGILNLWRIW